MAFSFYVAIFARNRGVVGGVPFNFVKGGIFGLYCYNVDSYGADGRGGRE